MLSVKIYNGNINPLVYVAFHLDEMHILSKQIMTTQGKKPTRHRLSKIKWCNTSFAYQHVWSRLDKLYGCIYKMILVMGCLNALISSFWSLKINKLVSNQHFVTKCHCISALNNLSLILYLSKANTILISIYFLI